MQPTGLFLTKAPSSPVLHSLKQKALVNQPLVSRPPFCKMGMGSMSEEPAAECHPVKSWLEAVCFSLERPSTLITEYLQEQVPSFARSRQKQATFSSNVRPEDTLRAAACQRPPRLCSLLATFLLEAKSQSACNGPGCDQYGRRGWVRSCWPVSYFSDSLEEMYEGRTTSPE
jgi:hypothetical protein